MTGKTTNLLPDDFLTTKRATPHREIILRLTLEMYVRRYGQDTPLDLDRLNSLLATTGQPLTNQAEIDVFYGHVVPASQCN